MRNLTLYAQLLGLGFVKGIANFAHRRSYVWFGNGRRGTIITFLLWPAARRRTRGRPEASEVSFAIAEPKGIFFENATDGPGSTMDEAGDALGPLLPLPFVFKSMRAEIEHVVSPRQTAAGK